MAPERRDGAESRAPHTSNTLLSSRRWWRRRSGIEPCDQWPRADCLSRLAVKPPVLTRVSGEDFQNKATAVFQENRYTRIHRAGKQPWVFIQFHKCAIGSYQYEVDYELVTCPLIPQCSKLPLYKLHHFKLSHALNSTYSPEGPYVWRQMSEWAFRLSVDFLQPAPQSLQDVWRSQWKNTAGDLPQDSLWASGRVDDVSDMWPTQT